VCAFYSLIIAQRSGQRKPNAAGVRDRGPGIREEVSSPTPYATHKPEQLFRSLLQKKEKMFAFFTVSQRVE
jgi:hypothetical protein